MREQLKKFVIGLFGLCLLLPASASSLITLEIDREAPSNSTENTITPRFLRNVGVPFSELQLLFKYSKKYALDTERYQWKDFYIGDEMFAQLKYSFEAEHFEENSETAIPYSIEYIGYYGFYENQVVQYCLIEPLVERIEPKILAIQNYSLLNESKFNTTEDRKQGITFYKVLGTEGKSEYYALLDHHGQKTLLLDAYLSEGAFLDLKNKIRKEVTDLATKISMF